MASPGRVAILPATILTADPSLEWGARAIPLILAQQLATSTTQFPVLALDQSAAYGLNAKAALRTSLEARNGRLIVKASTVNLANQRVEQVFEADRPSSVGLIAVVDQLARQMDRKAGPLGTNNQGAVMAYAASSQFNPGEQRNQSLQRAISLDPSFGAAQAVLIEAVANMPEAVTLLEKAKPFREKFTPLDQARFDVLSSQINRRPTAETRKALEALHQLSPGDLQVMLQLASIRSLEGNDAQGAELLTAASELEPANPEIRRRLADSWADAGNAQKAFDVYRDALAQKPGDLTTLSALGQLQFSLGRFGEAERTFQTVANSDPSGLLALAACRLLQNDPKGGDEWIQKYSVIREKAKDPLLPLVQANWLYMKGEQAQAVAFLQKTLSPQPDIRAIQLSQLSVWLSTSNQEQGARQTAEQAMQSAASPLGRVFAAISSFIAQSGTNAAEAVEKIKSWPNLDERSKNLALAYSLFIHQHYPESAKVWRTLLETEGQAYDARSRIMLASCYLRSGQAKEIKTLGSRIPIPNVSGVDPFSFLTLQESARVRGSNKRPAK